MPIPRLHLFELEDQSWFPGTIRDLATDYLEFVQTHFALHLPAARILLQTLRDTGDDRVIDLCSGGGGPAAALARMAAAEGTSATFVLTDLYPNIPAFERQAAALPGLISFVAEPVDARASAYLGPGVRTIFNGFHHFHPADARRVLGDAASAGVPIALFELSERSARTLVPMLFLTPLMVLLATSQIRPFTFSRFLWTYLLPLVPLTCWWDGWVSQMRAYTPDELMNLARSLEAPDYRWRAGKVPLEKVAGSLTYLIGVPADDGRGAPARLLPEPPELEREAALAGPSREEIER